MKKIVSLFVALAVLSVSSYAQDKQLFNHLSIGASVGLDGLGIEVATPVTPYVQLRAGYSIVIPTSVTTTYNFGSFESSSRKIDLTNVPITAGFWKGGLGKLIADIYPWPNIPFHFAAGLFIGGGKFSSISVDASKVLNPDEYATLAVGYNGVNISSDKNGSFNVDAKTGNVLPYVGIGFGHAVNTKNLVSVTFDLGVMIGGPKMQSYNYIRSDAGTPVELTSAVLDNNDKGIIDAINKFPVMPLLKLNVFFNVF